MYLRYLLSVSVSIVHVIKNVWKPLYVQTNSDDFLLRCNILRNQSFLGMANHVGVIMALASSSAVCGK